MIDLNDSFEKLSLKYSEDVPEGYDVSQIQFTYDFIYLVFKKNATIDDAIRGIAVEYGLSESYLMEFFTENKYLLSKYNEKDISILLKQYNTKALKKILKMYGLKTSGKRQKIEERIIKNRLIGNDYYLSSKSRVFYKNKKRRMKIFNQYLQKHYYFCEFNDFYMDNFRKKEENIPIEFIKRHINKAVEDENHRMFALNNYVMARHFDHKGNFKRMLEYVLKIFCINLNPVWKTDELKDHGGIPEETYYDLAFLNEKLGKNRIISAYFVVWDSFEFEKIIVSKYAGYKYLKKILNLNNLNLINRDLEKNFYLNDDLKIKKITQKTLFDF